MGKDIFLLRIFGYPVYSKNTEYNNLWKSYYLRKTIVNEC